MPYFLKCKMCGGDLRIISGLNIAECEYCGTRQSVPKTPDERKTSYFNRANEARRANEFDKAIGIYESIVAEYPDEAEAYWGLCLCRFGIEYVDDPKTGKKIPTCHRTVFDSIFEDKDYMSAVSNGDMDQRRVYEKEATAIDKIQKSIIKSVNLEKPYDVFICYKETNEKTGQRTRESVIGQEIYDELCARGIRTFFARVSLEDVLGEEYEPHIFAALNSSRIMLAVGSSCDNFNATWVRNEWSRYLELAKKDRNYLIIPCFIDMDPYDLPSEFSSLQAQNLGKVGAIQDIIRGISKILGKTQPNGGDSTKSAGSDAEKLIKRGMLAVEAKEWKQAENYFEQALNDDPEAAKAYWGKVLCEKRASNISDLLSISSSLNASDNYLRALRFADPDFKHELQEYEKKIQRRLSIERERKRKKGKTLIVILIALALCTALVISGIVGYKNIYIPSKNYKTACDFYNSGDYAKALSLFKDLGQYKDSPNWVEKCTIDINCEEAIESINSGNYENAIDILNSMSKYSDYKENAYKCSKLLYNKAVELANNNDYEKAIQILDDLLKLEIIDKTNELSVLYNNCYYEFYNNLYRKNKTEDIVETMLQGLGNMQLPRDSKCESLYSLAVAQVIRKFEDDPEILPKLKANISEGRILLNIINDSEFMIKKATLSYSVSANVGKGGSWSTIVSKTVFIENLEPHKAITVDTKESAPASEGVLTTTLRDYDIVIQVGESEISIN